jgi:hypothetical protein
VIDYMILEAVALKIRKEDADAQEKAERKRWKKEKNDKLETLR